MEISKHRCDVCGDEVEDRYSAFGWVVLELKDLSVSIGRDSGKNAKTEYVRESKLDFCSESCAVRWVRSLYERANQRVQPTGADAPELKSDSADRTSG